jgi:hypothetical protein
VKNKGGALRTYRVEVLDEGAGGEDSGEAGDELGGGGFADGGGEVSREVARLGGERGVASGRGARKRLGKRAREEARVRSAEWREEGPVGEREGEAGECVGDVVGRRGGRGGEEGRGAGEADAAARRGRQRVRRAVACAARVRRSRRRVVAVGFHADGKLRRSVWRACGRFITRFFTFSRMALHNLIRNGVKKKAPATTVEVTKLIKI